MVLTWVSVGVTAVVVAASLTGYLAYRNVLGNITRVNVSGLLGKRPPQLAAAMNILIIGSDTRAGSKGQYGNLKDIQGARSDTMLLLHILPNQQGGVVLSFPRDSMVPVLSCRPDGVGDPGQQAQPGNTEMLNATFAYGGAPCLWKTLEQLTGIYIDHFVQIDFNGFKSVINDLGGVNVCLPEAIRDPASGLDLPAGEHHVNGTQALAFVRERHIGQGSDLQRIQRQQYFMASVLQEVKSENLLANPPRLYKLATDVSKSLTTDSGFTVSTMLTIAESMKGLSAKKVQFVQVPVVPDPANNNRVIWEQPQANQLFSEIAHDQSVKKKPGKKPATPAVSPSQVQVDVLNGTGTAGLAARTASGLTQRHFTVVGTGNARTPSAATIIQYGTPADAAKARTLQQEVPGARVEQVPGIAAGTVDLILGSGFTGLKGGSGAPGTSGSPAGTSASPSPSPSASPSSRGSGSLAKTYGGITGNTNICKDAGAFSGPDVPSDFAP